MLFVLFVFYYKFCKNKYLKKDFSIFFNKILKFMHLYVKYIKNPILTTNKILIPISKRLLNVWSADIEEEEEEIGVIEATEEATVGEFKDVFNVVFRSIIVILV